MRLFSLAYKLFSRTFSLLIAAALLTATTNFTNPTTADAHGPTRQKLVKTVEINASPEKVWAVIKNFDNLNWHPAVEKTEGKGGNETDATRILTLKGGATIDELLYNYDDEGMSYSYRITKVDLKVLPVNNYSSTISVKAAEGGKSTVTWKGAFYRGYMNNDPPADLNEEAAKKAVSGVYESGLEALKKQIEEAK